MVVVPGIVHMPGIHIMPARLISPHWRRSWRRVYRAGRECLCPGLCRHCCADRRYTEHRGRSCCNHMLAHFQPPDVSFDDERSISNTAHHNQGGTEQDADFLMDSSQSFDHARAQARDIKSFLYYQKHLCSIQAPLSRQLKLPRGRGVRAS